METYTKEDLEYISQGSEAWKFERIGKFTASEFHRLVADAKRPMTDIEKENREKGSKATTIVDPELLSDGAITYIEEVLAELLTGVSCDSDRTTDAMDHGTLYEPDARRMYERVLGVKVTETGSLPYRPLIQYISGSPDGLIEKEGGIEVKCPFNNQVHISNMRIDNVWKFKSERGKYYWQILGLMLITGAKYWDFVSYSPSFPLRLCLHTVRINYKDVQDDIRLLAIKLKMAVKELERLLEQFKEEI